MKRKHILFVLPVLVVILVMSPVIAQDDLPTLRYFSWEPAQTDTFEREQDLLNTCAAEGGYNVELESLGTPDYFERISALAAANDLPDVFGVGSGTIDEWAEATINTDEYQSYNGIVRERDSVCHAQHEWARDDDGDGFCEVHCNTTEGLWTDVRIFLRPFKGVHKKTLAGYIALCEFRRNLKRISPAFIADLVAFHSFYP